MKNLKFVALAIFTITTNSFFAQSKTGAVTYELTMPENEEMAAMGSNTIKISFNEKSSATQMDMLGGMISMKSITVDKTNPKSTRYLMNAMGKKLEITGESNGFSNSDIASLKDAESVTYDKKDTRKILGYECYKAVVKMKNGMTSNFYITEAIAIQTKADDKIKLTGFPLEIAINSDKGQIIMLATSFEKEPSANCFVIPEGYEKVTPEELEQKFGGF